MSVEREYLIWRRGPDVGCMFARHLATRYADFPQRIAQIPSGGTPDQTSLQIASKITEWINDPGVAGATLLLPGLERLEDVARTMLALRHQASWSVTTSVLPPPPTMNLVSFHISRDIPFGEATCPSEILVLGPFDEFPKTRRAPVTALEMFVGMPMSHDPKTGAPTVKANLAHIETPAPTQTFRDKMWAASVDGRERSLGGPDNRAKAKVAFVVPENMARQLGCLP